jgi:hypothetical protein
VYLKTPVPTSVSCDGLGDKGEGKEANRRSGMQQRNRVQPTDLYLLYRPPVYFLVATLNAAQDAIKSQTAGRI